MPGLLPLVLKSQHLCGYPGEILLQVITRVDAAYQAPVFGSVMLSEQLVTTTSQ